MADGGSGFGATGEGGLRGEQLDHGNDVVVTQVLGGGRLPCQNTRLTSILKYISLPTAGAQ